MGKGLFFGVPAHGHTNPSLAVVCELQRRGEEIIYYSTEEFRKKIESAGVGFRTYQELSGREDLTFEVSPEIAGNVFTLSAVVATGAVDLMPHVLEEVEREKPGYIMHDALAAWGKLAGRIVGLPAVSSISTFAINAQFGAASSSAALDFIKMFAADPLGPFRYARAAWTLRRRWGRRGASLLDVFVNEEDLNLVYTSRDFQPKAETFPESFRFIGPAIRQHPETEAGEDAFPWELLEGRKVIYISMGTIFYHVNEFYRKCFEAFRGWDGVVVLSAGMKTDLDALGSPPDNFIVRNFVPQVGVLERASLFVTHAGMNSVSEALLAGVPLVCLPHGADQFVVARRIEKLGAGLRLDPKSVAAQGLAEAAHHVLDDAGFAERACALGQSLGAAGGYVRAADEILDYVQSRQS